MAREKKKHGKRLFLPAILLMALMIFLIGFLDMNTPSVKSEFTPPVENSTELSTAEDKKESTTAAPEEKFEITMLNVGQGLSVLIRADDEYMLYDGGGRSKSSYVVSYLTKTRSITNLKYIVSSHYDEDHVAGLVGVMNTISVGQVITSDYEGDTKIYQSFRNKLAEKGYPEIHPKVGDTFALGSAVIQVIGPTEYNQSKENDNSIAIKITYGNFSAVFTGDAEEDECEQIITSGLNLNANLYIVGHHGSEYSTSDELLKKISPQYAFLSVGSGNSYGHPTAKTLNALKANNVQLFRTDVQGEVSVYSDGNDCWFSTDPTDDWSAGIK